MDWLLKQAETASPFVAVFSLGVAGILWRQHLKDARTVASLVASSNRAMIAATRAITRLGTIVDGVTRKERRQ